MITITVTVRLFVSVENFNLRFCDLVMTGEFSRFVCQVAPFNIIIKIREIENFGRVRIAPYANHASKDIYKHDKWTQISSVSRIQTTGEGKF